MGTRRLCNAVTNTTGPRLEFINTEAKLPKGFFHNDTFHNYTSEK